MVSEAGGADSLRGAPAVWGGVPQRNKNFTGRESLLADLRHRVTGEITAVLPHALQGLGGVGKTLLAIEYAYRYAAEYEVVWWISADQSVLIRSTLAALAPRLGITGIGPERVEEAVRAVLDSLRRGEPYSRWLLIFDNADLPESIWTLLPNGPGDVLITSRNSRWQSIVDTVEVAVFTRSESLEFLHRRVPGSNPEDSNRLAEELGDLPLALEQAGALQAETGMSVAEYLDLFRRETRKLLAENKPFDYPWPVAAAWHLAVARLQSEMPFALELLRRCAFFGPGPIPRDVLQRGGHVLGPPLRQGLNDPIIISRAMRELGRYALARIDSGRRTVEVHRLVQKLLRDELAEADAAAIRHEVHLLLAAANPAEPDEPDSWPGYRELLGHLGPSRVAQCPEPAVRRLMDDVTEYLYIIGDYTTCFAEMNTALDAWDNGAADDPYILRMLGRKAHVLWALGRYAEAAGIRQDVLRRGNRVFKQDDEYLLYTLSGYGADLRAKGDFAAALQLDEELLERHRRALGTTHPETLMQANNVALDFCLNGEYSRANQLDQKNYQDRIDTYGRDAHHWMALSLSAIARDQLYLGKYSTALRTVEQADQEFAKLIEDGYPETHPRILMQAKDRSLALRKAGSFTESLAVATRVHAMYKRVFGDTHPETLGAAVNLSNARRAAGDPEGAAALMIDLFQPYSDGWGDDHPFTHGGAINLAIALLHRGDLSAARTRLEQALKGLQRRVGKAHPYSLICLADLAVVAAEADAREDAQQFGSDALAGLRTLLGEDHPHTLTCAANLTGGRLVIDFDPPEI